MNKIVLIARTIRCFSTKISIEMKYLNVAEKNDAAKTIAGFLSNGSSRRREGYSVYNKIYEFETLARGSQLKMVMTSVSGHLLNYEFVSAYRGWNTCDPQQLFDAPVRKSCIKDNEPIQRTLEREIRSCQGLIIWTDCDREGENIGFEIIEVCKAVKPNISVFRARFSEITAIAARRALANLIQPDKRANDAVDVRQELDLRTGAAFTRLQTLRLQRIFPAQIAEKLISYGSCQIPTLGFVAARYKEAEEFVSEPFWKIKVTHTIDDLTVEFNWDRNRLFDKEACEDYLLLCLTDPMATVENVTTKPKNKWRPVALDTVELEKLGSRKLKINAKTVMSIAEKLYQQGFISYPRTETNQFSKEINLRGLVEHHTSHQEWGPFASRVLEWGPNPRNGNKSDEAHPPIHPIKLTTGLSGNEQRVYELIVRHFLACLSKDATGSETIVNIKIAGEKFHATGLCIFERNYLDVYPYEKWNAKQIHRYEIGQVFEPTEIAMVEGATSAPPLLTEADLIALMDKHGIGTDATHAEHINTIKERGYIGEVDRGFLVPGTIGMGLYEGYHAMELPLAEPVLRAGFEADLKLICSGQKNPTDVLKEQIVKYKEAYRVFGEKIRALDEQLARRLNETPQENVEELSTPATRLEEICPCPKCSGSSLILKLKKDGTSSFLTCTNYPDCKNAIWFPSEIKTIRVTETTCNRCGPSYRLLEFKFSQPNYLVLLNASGNTYTTCIACDSNFRDLFHINIENVKRVGSIVSNRNHNSNDGRTIVNQNPNPTSSRSTTNSNARSTTARNRNTSQARINDMFGRSSAATRTTTSNSREFSSSTTVTTTSAITTTITTTTSSSSSNSNNPSSRASRYIGWNNFKANTVAENAASRSNTNPPSSENHPAFDDAFDEIFLNDDWNLNENTEQNRNNNVNSSESRVRETTSWDSEPINWGSDSIIWDAVPNNSSNNQNNISANLNVSHNETMSWGSTGTTITIPLNNCPAGSSVDNRNESEPSSSRQNTVRCTACNKFAKCCVVRKEGPNKGRSFYVCTTSCNFFQWADVAPAENPTDSRNTSRWANIRRDDDNNHTNRILCSCNKPVVERTVRKEGPNTGRQFYVCAKGSTQCDFFKWADENVQPNFDNRNTGQARNSATDNGQVSWGTGNNNNNRNTDQQLGTSSGTGSRSNSTDQPSRKRKCGLCRVEGHTKLRCPRKEEFGNL